MTGLFASVLFATLCENPFVANILMVVLVVWLCLFFGRACK